MFRLLLRVALLLPILTGALIVLMHGQAYDDARIMGFFDRQTCTPMPCWQGIRPGETKINQALAILRRHPWVDKVSEVYPVPYAGNTTTILIYWTWSSAYPFAGSLNYSEQGIIITEKGWVRQIYLTSSIPFGDLWLALGGADGGAVEYQFDTQSVRMDNTALFADEGVAATAMLTTDCSYTYPDLWRTPVYMWLKTGSALGTGDVAFSAYLRGLYIGYQRVWAALC